MDDIVDELNELLRPAWGAEKWIWEGWSKINQSEKDLIKHRLYELFKDGLPFEIKNDKLIYIYTFSLLAQLEVLAIQVPLRFEEKMPTPQFRRQMRTQLLDEIFHGLVFTKIVYMLSAPFASPPEYNEDIEVLCNFIRNEECPKVGVVLLNLVAEGWIEEIFKSLHQQHIAPKVFATIIEDEHRHVCEADLYCAIGVPDQIILSKKLRRLEELLLTSLSLQPKYAMAVNVLLGPEAVHAFILAINEKHTNQLKKINMVPSKQWQLLIQLGQEIYNELEPYSSEAMREANREVYEVEMTPIRKAFMTQWDNPGCPTMVSQFNIDVSCLEFFKKKFPPETLTTLMMQAVSKVLMADDSYRNFLSYKKMYQSRHAYVSVVVKLPDCGDHIGNIVFRNCHELALPELAIKIKRVLQMMSYCYKKREQIEQAHPALKRNLDRILYGYAHDPYPYPVPGSSVVSVSSIGFCGYSQAVSPLRKQEGLKVTLLMVERKPVWNEASQSFEPKDILPVSISADHRIFDGNLPIPKMLSQAFQVMFQHMLQRGATAVTTGSEVTYPEYKKIADRLLEEKFELMTKKAMHPSYKKATKKVVDEGFEFRGVKLTKHTDFKDIAEKMLSEEMTYNGEQITKDSDFQAIADDMLQKYLHFDAREATKDLQFTKMVDKMLAENLEMGYRALASLQNMWFEFVNVEEIFHAVSKKMANIQLNEWVG